MQLIIAEYCKSLQHYMWTSLGRANIMLLFGIEDITIPSKNNTTDL